MRVRLLRLEGRFSIFYVLVSAASASHKGLLIAEITKIHNLWCFPVSYMLVSAASVPHIEVLTAEIAGFDILFI